jgi:hypothetical protein
MEELINKTVDKFGGNGSCPPEIAIYIHGLTETNPKLERNLIEYNHH